MNGGMGEGRREAESFGGEEIRSFITLRNNLTLQRRFLAFLGIIDAWHLESYRVRECRGLQKS